MDSKKKKTMFLNTLTLIICVFIIGLFCFNPKKEEVLDKYNVVFDTAGGSYINALEVEEGSVAAMPTTPTKEGYEFVGWMLGDELYDFSKEVSGDITLRAEWHQLDPDITYYTITFDSAGGNNINSIFLEEGSIPTEPPAPTREGYEFSGWYYNDALFDFTLPLNQNVTLVAQWVQVTPEEPEEPEEPTEPEEPEEKTYTVRFNLNGGKGSIKTQTVKAGEKAKKPANPTRSGYTFNGWRVNSSSGKAYDFNSKVNANVTLYASWTALPSGPNSFTVRFLGFNEEIVSGGVKTVKKGAKATAPSAPKIPFYSFVGWFTAKSGGTNVNSTTINRSMDFYARYQKSTITVSCPRGSNEVGGSGIFCTLKITASNSGYLPGTAGIKIGDSWFKNGSSVPNGVYTKVTSSTQVCESQNSENCTNATIKK